MSEITTIGLDLAKHVFQLHGIDAKGTTVTRSNDEASVRRLHQGHQSSRTA
jgi:transposase